jgi:hypothetical protein
MSISRIENRAAAPPSAGSSSGSNPSSSASSASSSPSSTPSSSPSGAAAVDGPSPFARLLHGLGDEAKAGEATIRSAVRASAAGKDLGPSELLALQAGVYRYSEVIDLAAKLVDRASNGVKTVLSGQ